MVFYWLIYFYLVFIGLIFPTQQQNGDRIFKLNYFFFVIVLYFTLVFFAGFRTESNDYSGYEEIYNTIPPLNKLTLQWILNKDINVEYGYIYLNSFLKLFSNNVVFLMLFVASISVGLNVYVIKKLSPYVFLSIILYFVHNFIVKDTIQIRQGLASALIFFGLYNYNRRIVFCLLILIAGSIQSTAYICFLPLLLSNFHFTKKQLITTLLIVLLLSILFSGRQLLDKVLQFVNLPDSVMYYFGWDIYDFKLGLLSPVLIKQTCFFLVMLKYKEELNEKFEHFNIMFNFYFFSIIWYIYFNDFAIIAGRVTNLLSVGEIILIPMLISILSKKNKLNVYMLLIVYAGLILYMNLRSDNVFPYNNIFFK
jgi:hypothetical protein